MAFRIIKKTLIFFSLVLLFSYLSNTSYAQESIQRFEANINVLQSGSMNVSEKIYYDFSTLSRHGIYRDIPLDIDNDQGETYLMTLRDIGLQINEVPSSLYTLSTSGDTKRIKIGDPNKTVTGVVSYTIDYTIDGGIRYFEDHDEVYWNVTGNEWGVPINIAVASVKLPDGMKQDQIQVACYTGGYSSNEKSCTSTINGNRVDFLTNKSLGTNEGLTIVVGFPKGYVDVLEPTKKFNLLDYIKSLPIFVYILIGLFVLGWYFFYPIYFIAKEVKYKLWVKNNKKEVAAWFSPPKDPNGNEYLPAEAATLVTKNITHKHITATIVHLASRGYLKIFFKEKAGFFDSQKILIQDLNKDTTNLKNFEETILDGLFNSSSVPSEKDLKKVFGEAQLQEILNNKDSFTDLEKLKNATSFYNATKNAKKQINDNLVDNGEYVVNSTKYSALAIINLLLSSITFSPLLFIAAMLPLMSKHKLSITGLDKYSEALSLFNFLKSQDAQYDFQAEQQMFFEKLLPYATAFGVEDVWIKRFPEAVMQEQDWYSGSNLAAFNAMSSAMNTSVQYGMGASSTGHSSGFSSGGGFSGGGGGGGGGGSW